MYTTLHLCSLPLGTKFRFYGDDSVYVILSRNQLNVVVECIDKRYPTQKEGFVIPLFVSACLRVIKIRS